MEKGKYINRLIEKELIVKLNSSGCVLVTGPKFCGKSSMCERFAKSSIALKTSNQIEFANADPRSTLIGDKPRLIDEWQKAPEIWNVIKDDLDKDYIFGKYILTGSTTPVNESKIQHSGAGRISTLNLKPFTLFESKESNGLVSLNDLLNNREIQTVSELENMTSLEDVAFYICRGGWPISLMAKKEYALETTKNYYDGLFNIEDESDEFSLFLKNKNIDLLVLILKSYARNISTQPKKINIIKNIIESGARSTLDEDTFNSYYDVLKKLFILYEMPAWNFNLRTSITVRLSPTIHFVDTSIATSALGIKPNDLLNDFKSFGYFFEDLAIRDLSVYAAANHATLKHYRDSRGKEIDAVIEFDNGDYGLIEIKIASPDNIKLAIKSLNNFEKDIIDNNKKKPKFKMVLTSHGACLKNNDIYIVPITYLKD